MDDRPGGRAVGENPALVHEVAQPGGRVVGKVACVKRAHPGLRHEAATRLYRTRIRSPAFSTTDRVASFARRLTGSPGHGHHAGLVPKPLRLNVFIDEQNIIKAIRPQPVMLDVVRLATLLVDQCNHVGGAASYRLGDGRPIIVCVGAPPHSGAPDYSCHLVKRRIWSAVDSVRVVEGDLVWVKEEHRWKQDAVDVAMGVEAVLAAAGHECDAVVLATADRDLSYGAKTCEERLAPHDGRDPRPWVFTASIPPHKIPGFRHIAIPTWRGQRVDVSGLVAADEEARPRPLQLRGHRRATREPTDRWFRALAGQRRQRPPRPPAAVRPRVPAGVLVVGRRGRRAVLPALARCMGQHCDLGAPAPSRGTVCACCSHRSPASVRPRLRDAVPNGRAPRSSGALQRRRRRRRRARRRSRLVDGAARASAGVRRGRAPVVSALLDVFCAQAYAARTVPLAAADRARADELYVSAIGSFSGTGERSYLAWTHLHRGRLHAAGGSDADAASELRAARQVAVGWARQPVAARRRAIAAVDRTESELARRRGDGALAALRGGRVPRVGVPGATRCS